ncbi:hypothetical protein Back11_50690 [Paenibacillus baekrokdamisoli]|uniref:FAD:protein FMN transferase n=1 Tax=Paenibacillus baekrokdamisoli TaxID=1712516 RepID=A0A3G9JLF2_9BACL|nr:FAD:protein FMN transferase [Paenibacillus baekrokdamisoli]MBB3068898.1 thiamine biosynthesis lipoprotein [Paenibacillus baekrokdamisoli]BBH23724.1 hypothetical protein Back11_50690 [Paenibacillus baekrokdamisoli]
MSLFNQTDSPHPSDLLHRFSFGAMNTTVTCTLQCEDEENAAELERLTHHWFSHVEKRFSRFLPDSELCHLNVLAGERCMISSTMLEVLLLAQTYMQLTEGIFNPFVLDSLLQCGYDDSFERIQNRVIPTRTQAFHTGAPLNNLSLQIDRTMKSVKIPTHSSIDLGGIVKSWAVERIANFLRNQYQVKQGLINAGGDLTVWGRPTQANPSSTWQVAIDDPLRECRTAGILVLTEGAAASSGSRRRRWQSANGAMHHLIHPFTLRPSDSDVVQCTVAGEHAVDCEIWAKTICILGSVQGLALLAKKSDKAEALLFMKDGTIEFYGSKAAIGERWQQVQINRIHEAMNV